MNKKNTWFGKVIYVKVKGESPIFSGIFFFFFVSFFSPTRVDEFFL